jgi:hypothetical protein
MNSLARPLALSWALLSCAGAPRSSPTCLPPPLALLAPVVPTDAGPFLPPAAPPLRRHRHRSCVVREVDGSVVDEVEEDLEPADINPLLERAAVAMDRVLEPMDASVVQRRTLLPPPETDAAVEPADAPLVPADGGTPADRPRHRHHRH